MKDRALILLKKHFGYDSFRPLQEEIISSILSKNDTVVIMPTGGGKSVCYQIPSLLFEGLTVVVSPLISLMKDQIDQLTLLGIPAAAVNSTLDPAEYSRNMGLVRDNKVKLLYLAPETLMKPSIIEMLEQVRVDCLAVDEAHCISDWGHDFRPEYRQIAKLRTRFSGAACIALTATATPRVQDDIRANLKMKSPAVFIASFNRENLFYQVKAKQNASGQILEFLEKFPEQSGIIYCFSRGQVDSLAARLAGYGYSVRPYHAGLSDDERSRNQELFLKDEVQIIVATIAFGMGIHKTNVRFVIHHDIPKSIESYYQETGRAGRDGLPAHCLLLYSYADVNKIHYFINQKENWNEQEVARHHISMLVDYAESAACRRIPLITYFGEAYTHENCAMCDNCTGETTGREDVTVQARMFLSCMKRTGERFGAGHLIDVLRGSESAKILSLDHHKLSTYGIGKEFSKKYWQHLSRQLIREGAILQDRDDYGALKATARGHELLKGIGTIHIQKSEENAVETPRAAGPTDCDAALFALLKKKRKEIAETEKIPPYIVFSDKSLTEMAAFFPQRRASFCEIYGVGAAKYERFGEEFIGVIKDYCTQNSIAEKFKQGAAPKSSAAKSGDGARIPKYAAVTNEYIGGASVRQLAAKYDVQVKTVLGHLYEYVMHNGRIPVEGLEEFFPDDDSLDERILAAWRKHGPERLKPVYDELNGEVDYETIEVFRLVFLCRE